MAAGTEGGLTTFKAKPDRGQKDKTRKIWWVADSTIMDSRHFVLCTHYGLVSDADLAVTMV